MTYQIGSTFYLPRPFGHTMKATEVVAALSGTLYQGDQKLSAVARLRGDGTIELIVSDATIKEKTT